MLPSLMHNIIMTVCLILNIEIIDCMSEQNYILSDQNINWIATDILTVMLIFLARALHQLMLYFSSYKIILHNYNDLVTLLMH